jgi:acetyl-CoA carboxylase biotin carboxyl carrier protein
MPDTGGNWVDSSGPLPDAGNQPGTCKTIQLPAEAQLADTSQPTAVVGTGTASSCTFAALSAAVSKGGVITFNCGSSPVTIPVTATLTPPTSNAYAKEPSINTVIDGGNTVTLDGQGMVRIMSWVHQGSWRVNNDTLTLQRIRFVNGKTTPTQKIPACSPSGGISNVDCSTGYDDGQGGGLLVQDGKLRIIDAIFENNQAALLGPDKLRSLLDLLIEKDIAEFEHEDETGRVHVVRGKIVATAMAPAPMMHTASASRAAASSPDVAAADSDVVDVTSPFVGTFYRSPTPDSPSFVDVGSMVRPGQTLCIIEAMKLMNEIESDVSGTITEVCAQNGKAVEFGQKLFRIKKA